MAAMWGSRKLLRAAQFAAGMLVVFGLSWASVAFTRQTGTVAAVWPADAVALALILRWARGLPEKGLLLVGTVLAEAGADLIYGSSVPFSLALASCNGVGLLVSAFLLRRLKGPIDRPSAFIAFLFGGVLIGPLAGAAPAVFVFKAFQPEAISLSVLSRWYFAVALGVAILTPFILELRRPVPLARLDRKAAATFIGAQAVYAALAAFLLFQTRYAPLVALFPFFVVAVMSHRSLGAVCAILTTSVLAMIATALGKGAAVIAGMAGVAPLEVLQLLLGCLILTAHPIAAMMRKLDGYAAEAERRRQDAEELSAIKTRLLAHVSHEIRSPLSGVTSLAELMRDGMMGELTPQQRESLAQIAQSGMEVESLARDLLDAATLQSGRASVHLVDVDVESAVESAVQGGRLRASEFGGSVTVVGAYCGGLKVAADRLRLRQILINLIVNGLKYGGRPPVVQVAAYATGRDTIRFEVSDNGAGLTEAQREALFRSFERLGAEKTDIEGAGLGLALSRELAQLQHGRLMVEDGDLGGARFVLELPCWNEGRTAAAA
jgi:signal transduction histidine kinase